MSIEAIDFCLPRRVQCAEDIARATGADAKFIIEKVGVRERHILDSDESGVGLSVAACLSLLARFPALRQEIDLVVCVTQNPDQRIPHNSAKIVFELGLGSQVASFDISLGCSGYVYGLQIVEGFLASTGLKNALLITCDPYSRVIAAENKDTNCVFGDAATVTWVKSSGKRSRMLACDFGTDGSQSGAISIPAGGASRPFFSIANPETQMYERDELRLHMLGRSVFYFVLSRVPESIGKCLERAGLCIDDIDYFALHQGSLYMLDALANKVSIPQEKLLKNMAHYGNTVSSSIPLLLAELDQKQKMDGARVLVSGFGVGLSWATAVLQFN